MLQEFSSLGDPEFADAATIVVPNALSYLGPVRGFVAEVAAQAGFDPQECYKVKTAVDEALTQILEHGFDSRERSQIEIDVLRFATGIRVVVRDTGMPFDATHVPEYRPEVLFQDPGTRSLNLFLIRQYMDEASFRYIPRRGNETRLVKYLKQRRVEEYVESPERDLQPFEVPPSAPGDAEPSEDSISVRLFNPDDAIEIAKCAYRTYGYTYEFDDVYYPERMIHLNATGIFTSAVVTADHGSRIIGHAALVRPAQGARVAEADYLFMVPEFRGKRGRCCLRKLGDFLLAEARKMGMAGLFLHGVANHPSSQKFAHRCGLSDCGLLLAAVDAGVTFKEVNEHLAQRDSLVLSYRCLEPHDGTVIYPPARHREMIGKAYASIGARPVMAGRGAAARREHSDVVTTVWSSAVTTIEVRSWGDDGAAQVLSVLAAVTTRGVKVVYLYCSMEDPGTPELVPELEAAGFFFAGICPKQPVGDALVMQYLNGIGIDLSLLKVESDFARELVAYVGSVMPS